MSRNYGEIVALHAPKANAICERFLGSARRECLDHLFILSEHHLRRTVSEYVAYFHQARPHQGIKQQIPAFVDLASAPTSAGQPVVSRFNLGG
jgi:putative transposase